MVEFDDTIGRIQSKNVQLRHDLQKLIDEDDRENSDHSIGLKVNENEVNKPRTKFTDKITGQMNENNNDLKENIDKDLFTNMKKNLEEIQQTNYRLPRRDDKTIDGDNDREVPINLANSGQWKAPGIQLQEEPSIDGYHQRPTIHSLNQSRTFPRTQSQTTPKSGNLLLDKLNNQTEEIEQLKKDLQLVKRDNHKVNQTNYYLNDQLRSIHDKHAQDVAQIKHKFDQQLKSYQEKLQHQYEDEEEVKLHQEKLRLEKINVDTKNHVLKQTLKAVGAEIAYYKNNTDCNSRKVEDLLTYNKVIKSMISSTLGHMPTILGQQLPNPHLNLYLQLQIPNHHHHQEQLPEESTTQLINGSIPDSTTQLLINSEPNAISIEKLLVNGTDFKACKPITKFRVLAKFVLFLVKVKSKKNKL